MGKLSKFTTGAYDMFESVVGPTVRPLKKPIARYFDPNDIKPPPPTEMPDEKMAEKAARRRRIAASVKRGSGREDTIMSEPLGGSY